MRKRPFLKVIGVLFIFLCSFGVSGSACAGVFNPVTHTLSNGLQVIVVVNTRAPVVTHMLWVKVGAADEEEGRSGLAHYLEHLMFKGTPSIPNGEYSRRIARVGGQENAFTTADYTAYFATVAPQHLGMVMAMEADRLHNLTIAKDVAVPELAVVLDERRQRVDSEPYGVFSQQMQAALFPHHPYGRPIIGWKEEIESLDADKATAFYRKWYNPANAVVVVSGAVDPDKVFAMAQQHYGGVPSGPVLQRQRVRDPDFLGKHVIEVEDPRMNDVAGERAVRVPSRRTNRELSYALEVLAEVLAGTDGAMLSHKMINEEKLVSTLDISYDPDALDDTAFYFSFIPAKDVAPKKILAVLQKHLQDFMAAPLPEDDVMRAKTSLARAAILARDSVMGPAYAFGMALTTGQDVEDVEQWPVRIKAVTPAQLKEALKLLVSPRQVAGILKPATDKKNDMPPSSAPPLSGMGPVR